MPTRQTPASPVPESNDDLAGLAAQVSFHISEAARHTETAKQLKEKIAAELGHEPKTVLAGDYAITYSAPRRAFDATQFVKAYPPETNAHMYKQVPQHFELDSEMIPPKLKQRFMVPGTGDGSVNIK